MKICRSRKNIDIILSVTKRNAVLIVVVVGVVIIAGGVFLAKSGDGFLAYHSLLNWFNRDGTPTQTPATQNPPCSLNPKPREFNREPYYTGTLIDAHVHMPVSSSIVSAVAKRIGFENAPYFTGTLTTDYLICLFESEGIAKTFGFFMTTRFSSRQELNTAKKFEKIYPGKIAQFYMPAPYTTLRITPEAVRETLDKNKGLFKGIGEIKDFENAGLDNPYFSELYRIASDYNLIVMMHPFRNHKEVTEKILSDYPKVNFLLHGGDDEEWIMEVIKNHKNVYYSVDADLVSLYGWERRHVEKKPGKEDWLSYVRANFDTMLERKLRDWQERIEAYPDRFMWGTDRWYDWHFSEEVGGLIEEFGRVFIGRLPLSVQKKFAYENAERLISGTGR